MVGESQMLALIKKKNFKQIAALDQKLETKQNKKYFSSKVLWRSPYLALKDFFTKYGDLRIWH